LVIFAISRRKNANVLVEGRIQPAVSGRLAGKHDDTSGTQFQWEIKKCVGQFYIMGNPVISRRLLGHPINACDSLLGRECSECDALCLFFLGPYGRMSHEQSMENEKNTNFDQICWSQNGNPFWTSFFQVSKVH
jgi:hypothetical protein